MPIYDTRSRSSSRGGPSRASGGLQNVRRPSMSLPRAHTHRMTMPRGTTVYHGTDYASACAIIQGGVNPPGNNWGGGELGGGFYTATTRDGAEAYLEGAGAVLELQTGASMAGVAVTPWIGEDFRTYIEGNDFLVNEQDLPVSQYKFNPCAYGRLKVVAVYIQGERYSPEAYLEMFD